MGDLTRNFDRSELACHHCGKLPAEATLLKTAEFLEQVRTILGNQPVKVLSGYRCPVHNAAVGGASDSQHMKGTAADIAVKHLTPRQVQAKLAKRRDVVKGLGRYRGFTHVDRRPNVATWDG